MQIRICTPTQIPREKQYLGSESHQRQFLSCGYTLQRRMGLKDHKTTVVAAGMKNNFTVIMQKYITGERKHHYCLEKYILERC